MTRVELWMEGETPHLSVHTDAAALFSDVKEQLILMRDRLTDEIARGSAKCPFGHATTIPAREAGVTLKVRSKAALQAIQRDNQQLIEIALRTPPMCFD